MEANATARRFTGGDADHITRPDEFNQWLQEDAPPIQLREMVGGKACQLMRPAGVLRWALSYFVVIARATLI
jgi:hypothetical protein